MSDLGQSGATEFNVVVRGKPRCDDWTTLDEALEQAEAFLGLGCDAVTIEQRKRYRGDADLGGFLAWTGSGAAG